MIDAKAVKRIGKMRKKITVKIIAVLLVLTVLIPASGCSNVIAWLEKISGYSPYDIATVRFSEMEYSRPDAQQVISDIGKATEAVKNNSSYETIMELLSGAAVQFSNWQDMSTLTMIRFSIDTSDEKWNAENDYFNEKNALVTQAVNDLMCACARSEHKEKFEETVFGPGSLDAYVNYSGINDAMAELMRRNDEIKAQFYQFDAYSVEFPYNGFTGNLYEHAMRISDAEYPDLINELYKMINKELGPLMIETVKNNKKIAKEAGFDDYREYAFMQIDRRYTPAEASAYIDAVKEKIVPICARMSGQKIDEEFNKALEMRLSAGKLTEELVNVTAALDETFTEVYDFMDEYELYYLGYDANSADTGFTTYIGKYAAPFIYLKGTGSVYDFLSFTHEFGHFTDDCLNGGMINDVDLSEIASNTLQFLAMTQLGKTGFSDEEIEALRYCYLYEIREVFPSQALLYRFEEKLYALSEDELTLERANRIAEETLEEFGLKDKDYQAGFVYSWATTPHFLEVPFYVIGYLTSATVALQILEKELEQEGAGVKLYFDLIQWDYGKTFVENVERIGLDSPLSKETVDAVAATVDKLLTQ